MSDPPRGGPRRATTRAESLVLVNTGDGKGKSTAALGTAMRAAGQGWRVCVVQFVKSEAWRTGEAASAKKLGIDWWTLGDGFTWDSTDMERTQALTRAAWNDARRLIAAGKHRLVVLDEVTYPIAWGWIDERELVDVVNSRPSHVSVIITGRDATPGLLRVADTVTEMVKRKHAFDAGVAAMKGIEF